jgi:L-rhamnose mutarotase
MDEYENVHVDVFAHAVAFILKAEYGHHNYNTFIESLNKHLYGN